jgi:mRNA deadenylase 3'-5' endonuclease subunit Ccr4
MAPKRRAPKRPLVETNKEVRVKDSTHLSVVSYNLLAQDLLDSNEYLYTHCPQEQLAWDYRKDNLLDDLKQSSADVSVFGKGSS